MLFSVYEMVVNSQKIIFIAIYTYLKVFFRDKILFTMNKHTLFEVTKPDDGEINMEVWKQVLHG